MSVTTPRAPPSASRLAVAWPIPRPAAPVTNATAPPNSLAMSALQQVEPVVAQEVLPLLLAQALDTQIHFGGFAQPFRMRPVRSHDERLGAAELVGKGDGVILRVRHHANMVLENCARTLFQWTAYPRPESGHAAALVHVFDEMRCPRRAEFADQHPDIGETAEEVVEDQGRQRVGDRPFAVTVLPLPRRELERRTQLPAPGRGHVFLVVELRNVVADDRFGFVDTCPERIEVRITGTAAVGRASRQIDELGAGGQYTIQFGDRPFQIAQRHHRRGVDRVLVVKAPVLVDPLVERLIVVVQRIGVVEERLGKQGPAARIHDRLLDLLLLQLLQARVLVEVLRLHRLEEALGVSRISDARFFSISASEPGKYALSRSCSFSNAVTIRS